MCSLVMSLWPCDFLVMQLYYIELTHKCLVLDREIYQLVNKNSLQSVVWKIVDWLKLI